MLGVIDDEGQLCAAMLVLISPIPMLKRLYFYAPRGPVIDDPASPVLDDAAQFCQGRGT